jgi:hypothetical protein
MNDKSAGAPPLTSEEFGLLLVGHAFAALVKRVQTIGEAIGEFGGGADRGSLVRTTSMYLRDDPEPVEPRDPLTPVLPGTHSWKS